MKISLQSIRTETLKMIVYLQLKYIQKSYILCIDWTAGAMIATKSSDEHQLVHNARTMCPSQVSIGCTTMLDTSGERTKSTAQVTAYCVTMKLLQFELTHMRFKSLIICYFRHCLANGYNAKATCTTSSSLDMMGFGFTDVLVKYGYLHNAAYST